MACTWDGHFLVFISAGVELLWDSARGPITDRHMAKRVRFIRMRKQIHDRNTAVNGSVMQ